MASLSSWLRLYCVLEVIAEFNSYVLLATDANEFRNIAKEVVPETLANRLARLVSDVSTKQDTRGVSEETEYYYDSDVEGLDEDSKEETTKESNIKDLERSGEDMYVQEWKTRINFDELVERVKERLANELNDKLKNHILNEQDTSRIQSMDNKFEQPRIQNDKIKTYSNKEIKYSYDQNNFKTKKTYGYNYSKNQFQPTEYYKNINNYVKKDNEHLNQNMSPLKNLDKESEAFKNSKYNNQGQNIQNKFEGEIIDYDTSNAYVITDLEDKKYLNKGKQSNEMNHKEDNNSFHLHDNKSILLSTVKTDRNKLNINFNKEYDNVDDDSYKNIKKGKHKNKYEESAPLKQNYDNGISKQFDAQQKTFVNTLNNQQLLYDEFDLSPKRNNDSYEDYIIPKIKNKYASEEISTPNNNDRPNMIKKNSFNNNENSRYQVQYNNNNFHNVKPLKNDRISVHTDENIRLTEDYREVTDKSQEIKAKTESLWYNYDDYDRKTIKDDRSKAMDIGSEVPVQKSKPKGTMIPTREYFKMSSPNYYISLPTVVEKYDSEEPLPEKDRAREVIKHFVNPPARINKKVRLI